MDILQKLAEIFTAKMPDSSAGVPYMAEDEGERDKDARRRFTEGMRRKKKAKGDDYAASTLTRDHHGDATNTRVFEKDTPLRGL